MTQSAQAIRGPASSSYAGVPPALGAAAPPPYVFWLFIAFLMLEYIRPPILQQLRLQFLLLIVLPLIWLRNPHDRPWSPLLTVQVLFLGLCISEIALGENWFTAYVTARTM